LVKNSRIALLNRMAKYFKVSTEKKGEGKRVKRGRGGRKVYFYE
jgi:hypothetical protein